MSKRNRHSILNFYQLILFVFFVAIVGYLLVSIIDSQSRKETISENQTYTSTNGDISILVPTGFTVEDRQIRITLNSTVGEININRQSSSFVADLDGHLRRLAELNGLKYSNRENFTIDGFNATKADVYSNETDQYLDTLYFIFVDQSVYTFSASSPELFDELDQVARSFRYTGDLEEN